LGRGQLAPPGETSRLVVAASVRGHRFRMVRFLHLRIARNDHCKPTSIPGAGSVPRLHLRSSDVCRPAFAVRPLWGARVRQVRRSARAKTRLFWSRSTLMGLATVGVGLLPDYKSIGILAPYLLVSLRVIQGFAIGGGIWRRGDLRGGARCKAQARRCDGLDPGRWNIGAISCAGGDPDLPHPLWRRCIPALGLAYPLSAFRGPARHFSVDQAAPRMNRPCSRRMQEEGRARRRLLPKSFLRWSTSEDRSDRSFRSGSWARGVVWYTAQFYTQFFLEAWSRSRPALVETQLIMAAPSAARHCTCSLPGFPTRSAANP